MMFLNLNCMSLIVFITGENSLAMVAIFLFGGNSLAKLSDNFSRDQSLDNSEIGCIPS
jgi:hypothetical protein